MHLGPGDRCGLVTWRTKPSTLNHAAFYSANLSSENFFTVQYLHSWRLSIEKLKIRCLNEKIIECDWNCYSIHWYFIISAPSQETVTLFPSWNMEVFFLMKYHEIHSCPRSLIWSKLSLYVGFAVFYSSWIDWNPYVESKGVAFQMN